MAELDQAHLRCLPFRDEHPGVSLEISAVSTAAALENLKANILALAHRTKQRTQLLRFISITWKPHQQEVAFDLATFIQDTVAVPALLHVTCHYSPEEMKRLLQEAVSKRICNILAVRGDPPVGTDSWKAVSKGFMHANELVAFIRKEFGDAFTVGVAGYPETHNECFNSTHLPPSEQARTTDLMHLKAKVDAGADFIITQFFYDAAAFLTFLETARAMGIDCPILPGYMPIHTYSIFHKIVSWCRVRVPSTVHQELHKIKEDDARVKAYSVALAVNTIHSLITSHVRHFHIFTLNMTSSTLRILEELRWISPKRVPKVGLPAAAPAANSTGATEAQPIFWANKAALVRSDPTAEFPNGRFSASSSPAFGELDNHYLSAKRPQINRRGIWGVPSSVDDIRRVFVSFLEGSVPQLPWCDSPPELETSTIFENLRWINKSGYLTINSQPRVNGARSDDPRFGWGGPDGVVYQKAYIEFFVDQHHFEHLLAAFPRFPSLTFHAMNYAGKELANCPLDRVNAVTWGVFPDKEILQTTVVDPASFRIWKDEAFSLWRRQWASVYSEETEADLRARRVIQDIHDTYWLVNIVDNDYVSEAEALFTLFRDVITDAMSEAELRLRVRDLEAENATLREGYLRLQDRHAVAVTEATKLMGKVQRLERELEDVDRGKADMVPSTTATSKLIANKTRFQGT